MSRTVRLTMTWHGERPTAGCFLKTPRGRTAYEILSVRPLGYVPHIVTGGRAHSEKLRGPPCEARASIPLALRICCSALIASDMHILQNHCNQTAFRLGPRATARCPPSSNLPLRIGPHTPPVASYPTPHSPSAGAHPCATSYPKAAGHSRMSTADAQASLQGVEHSQQALSSVQWTRGHARPFFQGWTAPQVTDVIDGDFVIASADRFDCTDQVHLRPRRWLRHLAIEFCQDDSFSRVSRDDDCHAPPPRPAWPRAKDEPRVHALDGNLYGNAVFAFQGFRMPAGRGRRT